MPTIDSEIREPVPVLPGPANEDIYHERSSASSRTARRPIGRSHTLDAHHDDGRRRSRGWRFQHSPSEPTFDIGAIPGCFSSVSISTGRCSRRPSVERFGCPSPTRRSRLGPPRRITWFSRATVCRQRGRVMAPPGLPRRIALMVLSLLPSQTRSHIGSPPGVASTRRLAVASSSVRSPTIRGRSSPLP